MSTKTLQVEVNGKLEIIEYKTSLIFGDVEKLRKSVYKGKNPIDAEFDVMLYKRMLMEMTIIKAPFDPKNYTQLYEMDGDVVQKIEDTLLEEFPIVRIFGFLGKMMTVPTGTKA